MAYDEAVAARIRALLGDEPDITEMRMFGGLAFLVRGNMAVAASSDGGIMVRVHPEQGEDLVAHTDAYPMEMRGRSMPGWLRVGGDALRTDEALARWVEMGVDYARTLPAKPS
jgi:TfoX/Sxy family transcriptional regulator of competence genes